MSFILLVNIFLSEEDPSTSERTLYKQLCYYFLGDYKSQRAPKSH